MIKKENGTMTKRKWYEKVTNGKKKKRKEIKIGNKEWTGVNEKEEK